MGVPDLGLMLVRASSVVPERMSIVDWQEGAMRALAGADGSGYAQMCDSLFGPTPFELRALCERSVPDPGTAFGVVAQGHQLDLARRAVAGLLRGEDGANPRLDARMLVYATNSIDEHYFRSTVANVAVDLGLASIPHFSVGQAHGSALDLAIGMIGGALAQNAASALFLAAERWPMPYPRAWGFAPLSDGAAALVFSAAPGAAGLQHVDSVCRGSRPFLSTPCPGGPAPLIDRERLRAEALEAIRELLDRQSVGGDELEGWLSCSLDGTLDGVVRGDMAPAVPHVIGHGADAGDAASAAPPMLLASLLDLVLARRARAGGLWLSWSVALGGTVSASLWRARPEAGN